MTPRRSALWVLALIGFLVLITSPALAQTTFTCVRPGVTDGDTLRCEGGQRVRLWGIHAPERSDPGGPASTRALAEIVRGQTLLCRKRGTSWGRTVGQCWIGSRDVSAEMVRRGQAADWPEFSKGYYAGAGK